jgi:PAS domain S-box-containing protein
MVIRDYHPEWAVRKVIEEGVPQAIAEGSWQGETALLGDGREIPISQVIIAHRTKDGKLAYLSTVARDISERIRAEAELRASQERSEILAKATNDAIWDWNLVTIRWSGTRGSRRCSGTRGGSGARRKLVARAHSSRGPADGGRDIHGLIDSGENFWSCEYRFLRADGTAAHVFDRGYVIYDDEGKPIRMIGAMLDLSERVQAEQALRESQTWLQLAVSAAQIGLWDWDTRSGKVFYSPEWKSQLGYKEHEVENRFDAWERLVHPEDLEPAKARIAAYLENPWPNFFNEFRMRHRDGSYRWILAHAQLLPDEQGNLTRMVGSHVDITEQKLEEERMLGIARAVSGAPGEGFFAYLVEQAAQALGADCALIGVLEADGARIIRTLAIFRDGRIAEPVDYDLAGTPCDGVLRDEACLYTEGVARMFPDDGMLAEMGAEAYAGAPLSDAEGRARGVFVVLFRRPIRFPKVVESTLRIFAVRAASELQRIDDEGERRHLEAQVQHAQKLESLGVLAGGIAHDFNNLLLAIIGNVGLAQMESPPASSLQPLLDDIERAAQRAADLCRQLLAYSGKGKFVVRPIDLNEIVREMTHLLELSVSKKAKLNLRLSADLPLIEGDPTQVRQILMNLITNASDAIGDKIGVITISTGTMECDREYLMAGLTGGDLPEGRYVALEVADTGCGMDEATLERIFDPFFTTKFTGRGLGLAAALGIIRGHGGLIRIESQPGEGSRFIVLFPALDAVEAGGESATPTEDAWKGTGVALVVDDEAALRTFAERVLKRAGFEVVLAEDGEAGVELFREYGDQLAFVLLDLTMPKLSGAEAWKAMRAINPQVPILLSSGFSEEEVGEQLAGELPLGFIQKPYRPGELLHQVRSILAHS